MTDRSKTRVFPLIELNNVRDLATSTVFPVKDLLTLLNTRAELGNTTVVDGVLTQAFIGTADDLLTPPSNPQPLTGGDYRGYEKVIGLAGILQSGAISYNEVSELVINVGGAGDYRTPHAWITVASSAINAVIGFIFAIEKASDGMLYFSQRPTGQRATVQGKVVNIAGGGFLEGLEEGDKLSLWAASSINSTLSFSNANLGVEMACPKSMKLI